MIVRRSTTDPLWTDLRRGRIVGLMLDPAVGGVADVSTTVVGQSGDATVSLRGLPRLTPMSGLVKDIFFCFMIYKIYVYDTFSKYI